MEICSGFIQQVIGSQLQEFVFAMSNCRGVRLESLVLSVRV